MRATRAFLPAPQIDAKNEVESQSVLLRSSVVNLIGLKNNGYLRHQGKVCVSNASFPILYSSHYGMDGPSQRVDMLS